MNAITKLIEIIAGLTTDAGLISQTVIAILPLFHPQMAQEWTYDKVVAQVAEWQARDAEAGTHFDKTE